MNFIGSKKIETERLILRPTEESDLKILWTILGTPEINKYYLVGKYNTEWEKELPWQIKKLEKANDHDIFQWSIVLKDTNECIGQISVQENGSDKTIHDIGWFITPGEHRKGYTFEAASCILKYMFEEVGINGIETSSAICNPASFKLMEKLGFLKRDVENTIVHYTFGGDVEVTHYGLSKEEYQNLSILIINNIKCNIESATIKFINTVNNGIKGYGVNVNVHYTYEGNNGRFNYCIDNIPNNTLKSLENTNFEADLSDDMPLLEMLYKNSFDTPYDGKIKTVFKKEKENCIETIILLTNNDNYKIYFDGYLFPIK